MARKLAIANPPKHDTAMSANVREHVEAVLAQNLYRRDPGVRPAAFISADGNLGKSTLGMDIAATYEEQVREFAEFFPERCKYLDRWIPVIWLECPAKLSIRSICGEIFRWCGEPKPMSKADDPTRMSRAKDILRDCGVQLLVADDITRYKDGREADMDASNFIRSLMTSVTLLAMGVDIRGSGILFDGKPTDRSPHLATQTGRRFSLLNLTEFSYDTDEEVLAWVRHLRAMEADLLLLDKIPGMLSTNLAEFFFRQTKGVIGTLADYILSATLSIVGRPLSEGGEYLVEADFLNVVLKGYDENQVDAALVPSQQPTSRQRASATPKQPQRKHSSLYNQPSRHGVK